MNIHLVNDEKFINATVVEFEKYFPNENIFFVDISGKKNFKMLKYVNLNGVNVFTINLSDKKAIDVISTFCLGNVNIISHSLSDLKAVISLEIKKNLGARLFWICNGADLYGRLMIKGKYDLFDENKFKNRFFSIFSYYFKTIQSSLKVRKNLFTIQMEYFKQLDYFCTWNNFDYDLFKRNYETHAFLKSFRYPTAAETDFPKIENQDKKLIMLNQSASKSGNHLTVLKKIKFLDNEKQLRDLILPLSYGATNVKVKINKYCKENLSYCFNSLDIFLNKEEYFEMLKDVKCAFFGHKRQEAANNVLFLLAFGAKVFLRRDNNLLRYFKQKGFHIYEFETDFNSIADLTTLDYQKQIENYKLTIKEFSKAKMEEDYKELTTNY